MPEQATRESYDHASSSNVRIVFEMHEVKELLDTIDALRGQVDALETSLCVAVAGLRHLGVNTSVEETE